MFFIFKVVLFPPLLFAIFADGNSNYVSRHWDIFQKKNQYKALPLSEHSYYYWIGFLFSALGISGAPFWWWFWGLRNAIICVLFPISVAIATAFLIRATTESELFLVINISMYVYILVQFRTGLYVAKHHSNFRRRALVKSSWLYVGSVCDVSARKAVKTYRTSL